MIQVRRAAERGHADHGWLNTCHTFSFADYFDPAHVSFRALRVMNEDWVRPGQGFGMHGHRDMEIVTHVLEGALEHRDSMGNGSVLRAGEFQRMTAGTGVMHSEFNPSAAEPVHLYQVWLLPDRRNLPPSYEQRGFDVGPDRLRLVAAPDGRDDSMIVHQDALLYLTRLGDGGRVEHTLAPGRAAWLQVLRGEAELNGQRLAAGDGAAVTDERNLWIAGAGPAEVLLFDLA